ncbi:hypothetical protein H4W01_001215 [Sphingomonas sp. PL20]
MRIYLLALLAGITAPAMAQTTPAAESITAASAPSLSDIFAVHGQFTLTAQGTPGFSSPYAGQNSLTPHQIKETVDATLYAGVRPWQGGEVWINPEMDQGFGLSNTLGVAGFPSAEAYKVGKSNPYFRLQRLFFRQTINLGGARDDATATLNQFAARRTADRVVVTLGKFGVGDVFDTNRYAHDPRADFINWTLVDAGSFDYAADAWGYSTGAAVEWYRGPWTVRGGLFNLSKFPMARRWNAISASFNWMAKSSIATRSGRATVLSASPSSAIMGGSGVLTMRWRLLQRRVRLPTPRRCAIGGRGSARRSIWSKR